MRDHYGKVPNIERIIYKTVAVESTKATMLESGEADLAWLNANYAERFPRKRRVYQLGFQDGGLPGRSMNMESDFWKKRTVTHRVC